jgi:hypothetical protein
MNRTLLHVSSSALVVLSAVGVSTALLAQDAEPKLSFVPAPASGGPHIVDASISLTSDVSVDVQLWLSEPLLIAEGSRSVRVVSLTADYNVRQLSVNKAYFFGPIDSQGAEPIDASGGSVSLGIAKMLAAQILGESRSPDIPPAESVRFGGRCECWRGGGDSLSVSLMPDGPRSGGAAVCPGNTVPRC